MKGGSFSDYFILVFLVILLISSKSEAQTVNECWTSQEFCYDPNLTLKPGDVFEWQIVMFSGISEELSKDPDLVGMLQYELLKPLNGLSMTTIINDHENFFKINEKYEISSGDKLISHAFSDIYISPTIETRENQAFNRFEILVEEHPLDMISSQSIIRNDTNAIVEGVEWRVIEDGVYTEVHDLIESIPTEIDVNHHYVTWERNIYTGVLLHYNDTLWNDNTVLSKTTIQLIDYYEKKQSSLQMGSVNLDIITLIGLAIIGSTGVLLYIRWRKY